MVDCTYPRYGVRVTHTVTAPSDVYHVALKKALHLFLLPLGNGTTFENALL